MLAPADCPIATSRCAVDAAVAVALAITNGGIKKIMKVIRIMYLALVEDKRSKDKINNTLGHLLAGLTEEETVG